MKKLENLDVQEIDGSTLLNTSGGHWPGGGGMSSVNWDPVTDAFVDAGQWVLGLFAGISDGISAGLED